MNAFNNVAQKQGYTQGAFPNGVRYVTPTVVAKPSMTDPLTTEERKLLSNHDDLFDLRVTPQEIAFAVCAHKSNDNFDIVSDGTGGVICKTCHAKFNPDEVDDEYVEQATDMMMNVLQTSKMLAVDLNPEVMRQYFSMIPYIKRVPKLFKAVSKSFQRYTEGNQIQNVTGGPNVFSMFNSIMNPAVPMMGYTYPTPTTWGGAAVPGQEYVYPTTGWGTPATAFTNQQNQMVVEQTPFYTQPVVQTGQQVVSQADPNVGAQGQPQVAVPQGTAQTATGDAQVKQQLQL